MFVCPHPHPHPQFYRLDFVIGCKFFGIFFVRASTLFFTVYTRKSYSHSLLANSTNFSIYFSRTKHVCLRLLALQFEGKHLHGFTCPPIVNVLPVLLSFLSQNSVRHMKSFDSLTSKLDHKLLAKMHNNRSQISPEAEGNGISTAIVWKGFGEQRKPRRRSLENMLGNVVAHDGRNKEDIVRESLRQV